MRRRSNTGPHLRRRVISGIMVSLLVGMTLLSVPASVVAETTATEKPKTESRPVVCPLCGRLRDPNVDYPTKAGTSLLRGATNALFGWTEIIRQPAQDAKAGGDVATGLYHGLTQGVARTIGGAGEMLTFWMPKAQDKYLHFNKDCPLCMGRSQPEPPSPNSPSARPSQSHGQ